MRTTGLAALLLAYLGALAWLRPLAQAWDALAFLMGARAGAVDYGHFVYLPALRGAARIGSWLGLGPESSAQGFSVLGAAVVLALLVRRARRAGAGDSTALLAALLFATTTLVWQESGSIEPSSWTLAALLLAAELAALYARTFSPLALAGLVLAAAGAVGLHLVSLCALPWLAWIVARERRLPPRKHLVAPVLAVLVAGGLFLGGSRLPRFLEYWSGFVPAYADGVTAQLAGHGARAGRLVLEGAPVLFVAGVLAAALLARRRRAALQEALVLALPYLLTFAVLGKPLVALLLPVLLACAFLVGELAACTASGRGAGAVATALGAALALQLGLVLPQARAWSSTPDPSRARADLVARYLPEGTLLFAGQLANHLRYYHPEIPVVSLPELWHDAFSRQRSSDPIAVVSAAVAGEGRSCVLSSDGVAFLQSLEVDPARLGISVDRALLIPEDPRFALFLLRE